MMIIKVEQLDWEDVHTWKIYKHSYIVRILFNEDNLYYTNVGTIDFLNLNINGNFLIFNIPSFKYITPKKLGGNIDSSVIYKLVYLLII